MKDFTARFEAIFRRATRYTAHHERCGEVTIKAQRLVGEDPERLKKKFGGVLAPSEFWKDKITILVDVTYPETFVKAHEPRELLGNNRFIQDCIMALMGVGIGPLAHNIDADETCFTIWTYECMPIYRRLPPAEEWTEKND